MSEIVVASSIPAVAPPTRPNTKMKERTHNHLSLHQTRSTPRIPTSPAHPQKIKKIKWRNEATKCLSPQQNSPKNEATEPIIEAITNPFHPPQTPPLPTNALELSPISPTLYWA